MKIIFFYPDNLTQEIFYSDKNIIFCDRNNFLNIIQKKIKEKNKIS